MFTSSPHHRKRLFVLSSSFSRWIPGVGVELVHLGCPSLAVPSLSVCGFSSLIILLFLFLFLWLLHWLDFAFHLDYHHHLVWEVSIVLGCRVGEGEDKYSGHRFATHVVQYEMGRYGILGGGGFEGLRKSYSLYFFFPILRPLHLIFSLFCFLSSSTALFCFDTSFIMCIISSDKITS